jgi:hypothetical protein
MHLTNRGIKMFQGGNLEIHMTGGKACILRGFIKGLSISRNKLHLVCKMAELNYITSADWQMLPSQRYSFSLEEFTWNRCGKRLCLDGVVISGNLRKRVIVIARGGEKVSSKETLHRMAA